jgi:tRNA dimethylallyltransferase
MERKVIVIVGPTCSGKTNVGIELAELFNTEIISADSRQVYKYLTIGTAKPSKKELNRVQHHFIDKLLPNQSFNVNQFEKEALELIEKLFSKNKIPIVVGGSGLYVKALIDGVFDSVDNDNEFRDEMKLKREEFGNEYLYNELKKVDPAAASTMLPSNWKRVMRALEIFHITGESILKLHNEHKRQIDINFVQFGIEWEREILYRNIELRVDKMIEQGLVDEVKQVLELGYSAELNSLNTVGYKEIISYLKNEIPLDRAIELIKRNTRRYAKRQFTWFRKDSRVKWFDIQDVEQLDSLHLTFAKMM